MEFSRQSNAMNYNYHLPPNPRAASAGEIYQYDNANSQNHFLGTNLPHQAEISQQQQLMTYSDHQMLTNQQTIGGNNYGGNDSVHLFPQTPDESSYFQRQKELEEEKLRLERRQESSRQPNRMSYNGHLPPNPTASVGGINQYQTAHDEMAYGTNLPYQTEISQQKQFISYSDHQTLTNQQPIGGNNYRGNDSVNLFPQSPDESLYFQRQKQLEKEKLLLERKRQALNYVKGNGVDASISQALLEMNREDKIRRMIDEQRPTVTVYVKSLCMKRVNMYIKYQKSRPKDNNIEYWRKFVAEFFHPDAKKRWCVSLYWEAQRATIPKLTQDAWKCKLCKRKPGKGFEANYEILPILFKIKYDESGTIEEFFNLREPEGLHSTDSGNLTLIYYGAVQYTIYEKLRVVRKGRLLVDFSPNLKMLSFEFCSESHQEFISATQIKSLVREMNYAADQDNQSEESADNADSIRTCSEFVAFGRRLAKMAGAPMLDEYGYNKRYVLALIVENQYS